MSDIINKIDYLIPERVEWKKVVRQGKVIKKLICPPGFKAKGGRCVRMKPQELIKRKISSKKAQKKLHLDKGKVAKLERKKAKSIRKRAMITPAQASRPGGQHKEG
jgi:hypothetical protein